MTKTRRTCHHLHMRKERLLSHRKPCGVRADDALHSHRHSSQYARQYTLKDKGAASSSTPVEIQSLKPAEMESAGLTLGVPGKDCARHVLMRGSRCTKGSLMHMSAVGMRISLMTGNERSVCVNTHKIRHSARDCRKYVLRLWATRAHPLWYHAPWCEWDDPRSHLW